MRRNVLRRLWVGHVIVAYEVQCIPKISKGILSPVGIRVCLSTHEVLSLWDASLHHDLAA